MTWARKYQNISKVHGYTQSDTLWCKHAWDWTFQNKCATPRLNPRDHNKHWLHDPGSFLNTSLFGPCDSSDWQEAAAWTPGGEGPRGVTTGQRVRGMLIGMPWAAGQGSISSAGQQQASAGPRGAMTVDNWPSVCGDTQRPGGGGGGGSWAHKNTSKQGDTHTSTLQTQDTHFSPWLITYITFYSTVLLTVCYLVIHY